MIINDKLYVINSFVDLAKVWFDEDSSGGNGNNLSV